MKRPALMGIVNVTPDSFSGDGKLGSDPVAYALELVRDGADIIDLGAESTRPGATVLSAEQEWARLEPVLAGLIAKDIRTRARISVDTRYAETAARALAMGIDIINDVSGLGDLAMGKILEEYDCDITVMHALSVPVDPHLTLPPECDVVAEILAWKEKVTKKAIDQGIAKERLIYDPGIGFGKTAEQSLRLVQEATTIKASGGRWLYGHSRKSFMKLVADVPAAERDGMTLDFSKQLTEAGIDYLRVHNIELHVRFFGK